jgi:hypothetical protein
VKVYNIGRLASLLVNKKIASFVYGEKWLVTNYSNSFVIFAPYADVV